MNPTRLKEIRSKWKQKPFKTQEPITLLISTTKKTQHLPKPPKHH